MLVNDKIDRRPYMSNSTMEGTPLEGAFGMLGLHGSNQGVPPSNLVRFPSMNSNGNSAGLAGRVHLGELALGTLSEDLNTLFSMTIPGSLLVKKEWGMLSGLARWPSKETASNVKESDFVLDVEGLLENFTSGTGLEEEAKSVAFALLISILEAIRDERPPVFLWDRDPQIKLGQIQIVFAVCDYFGWQDFQQQHLEPFYEKFPGISLQDTPETVFSLKVSEEELAPLLTAGQVYEQDLLSRFRFLQFLKLEGPVSQDFLDNHLPPTLIRLDLLCSDMRGRILTRKEIALMAVAQWGHALQWASDELKADREVVLAAVAEDGSALQYASEALREDREVVLAALAQDGSALQYASEALRADREVVMAAVVQDGLALRRAPVQLKADRELVLAAVVQDGLALEYASPQLKADREVVLAAVVQDGLALEYTSLHLQADREVVMAAVAQNGLALGLAPVQLKADRGVVMAAVAKNGLALYWAPVELQADPEVLELARMAVTNPLME